MADKRIFIVCPACKAKNTEYDVVYMDDKMVEFRLDCCGCKQNITHRNSFVPNIMPQGVDMGSIIDQVMEKMGFPKKKEGSDFRVK